MPINNPFEVEFLDEALEFIESLIDPLELFACSLIHGGDGGCVIRAVGINQCTHDLPDIVDHRGIRKEEIGIDRIVDEVDDVGR